MKQLLCFNLLLESNFVLAQSESECHNCSFCTHFRVGHLVLATAQSEWTIAVFALVLNFDIGFCQQQQNLSKTAANLGIGFRFDI